MNYLLTIGIPTYNRASRLAETLDLWMAQIEKDGGRLPCQIVVRDNSSDGDTASMMETHREKPYVKYVWNGGNIGYGKNINNALLDSDGEFVWLVADNDIPLNDAVDKIFRLLEANRGVDFFAIDNTFVDEETREVVLPKAFFKQTGIYAGDSFLRSHDNVYAIGGIGTSLYRTSEIQKIVRRLGHRTTAHHTTVLTGALISDGRPVCVPEGVYYCDTRYDKNYSCREKFELGVQSHIQSMLIVEEYADRKIFDRSAHRRPFMKRIAGLMCIYIVGNKTFDLTEADIDELRRFDPMLGFGLRALKLCYRVNHKLLRLFLKVICRALGKNAASFENHVQHALIGNMRDSYANKYLAEIEGE